MKKFNFKIFLIVIILSILFFIFLFFKKDFFEQKNTDLIKSFKVVIKLENFSLLDKNIVDFIKKDIRNYLIEQEPGGDINKNDKEFIINFSKKVDISLEKFQKNNFEYIENVKNDYISFLPENHLIYKVEKYINNDYVSYLIIRDDKFYTQSNNYNVFTFNYNLENQNINNEYLLDKFNLNKEELIIKINKYYSNEDSLIKNIREAVINDNFSLYVKENKLHIVFDTCDILCLIKLDDIELK